MLSYSRKFLVSLTHWWKPFNSTRVRRRGESLLPVSPSTWNKLRNLGLLNRQRGSRGGKAKIFLQPKSISVVANRPRILKTVFTSTGTSTVLPQIQTYEVLKRFPIHRRSLVPVRRSDPSGTSFPTVFLSNARSMINKIDELCEIVRNNLCDIAVITESWLSSSVSDQLINIPGFITCRRDRANDQRGGGLCTFINSKFNFVELPEVNDPDIESQWFLLKPARLPRGINSIILGTVYHPPQNDDNKLRAHIFNSLDLILTNYPNSSIVILGDFNQFKPRNLCSSFKLKKLVLKPTRGNNVLDQIYSNLSEYYSEPAILPPLGSSDHSSVFLQPTGNKAPSLPTAQRQRRDCRVSNKNALFSSLQSVNWTPLYRLNSCENQLQNFQDLITEKIDIHLPTRTVKVHPTDKPWMTPDIKATIKKRQRAWLNGNSDLYRLHRNKVMSLCKSARRRFYHNCISHLKNSNPKKWWSNIKLLSGQSKPAPLSSIYIDGTFLKDMDLAEAINDAFGKVTDDIPQLDYTPTLVTHIPDEFIISPEAVQCALSRIKEHKSNGPDEIPNWLLKNLSPVICRPVCSIFNLSISEGYVPSLWKQADVLPLPKIPKPLSIDSDLRPISLTAVLSKVLEGFVFQWLSAIIMPHIDPFQFGGVKKSSTTHALVHLVHQWLLATETPKTVVRSCMIDFSKAFDRIDHNVLICKLQRFNVPPVLLNWCASFLQNRQQRVKLGKFKSTWKTTNAGVPQGTKLGPLFFLVMVNDLTTAFPLYKFVDDCTVSEVVSLTPGSTSNLQREIDDIARWTSNNNMKLNAKKTKEFIVTFAKSQPSLQPLVINDQPLELVHTIKLLGVHLSNNLKWDIHIEHVCTKASKRLYALRILRRSGVPSKDLRSVYCSFIRPVLEYACPVWHSSLTSKLDDEVEKIQRRAIRIICPRLSYAAGLVELKLPTLFDRRETLCKSFYSKVLRAPNNLNALMPDPVQSQYNLRKTRKFPIFKCRTKRFQDSFLPYCVRKWDALV